MVLWLKRWTAALNFMSSNFDRAITFLFKLIRFGKV